MLDCNDKKHSNTNKLVTELGANHDMFIVPAFKETVQISRGRGQRCLVTLWRKGLTKYTSRVPCSNFRILATKFAFPSNNFLVVNVYFPCDPRVENFDESEIVTLLADINSIVSW